MQTKPAACGKRLLALVLAIVMVCSLLPVSAFAAEPDYELRVLTFEDADYKGGTNFAGGNNWTSLIDSPVRRQDALRRERRRCRLRRRCLQVDG